MPFPVPGRMAEFLRRATVQVSSANKTREQGCGSGIVLADGRILTNAHVTAGQSVRIETWEGKTHAAQVSREDKRNDLALIAADGVDAPPAALAGEEAKAGQAVIAVGHPLGFIGAVSTGYVHTVGKLRGLGWRRWIQSDVRLAPGNSGGPLANISGEIVGVNTMIAGGWALAVPASTVQRFLSQRPQASLGVVVRQVMLRSPHYPVRPALLILELKPGGAAERAALLAGDILIDAADAPLHSPDDLAAALANAETLQIGFHRSGDARVRRVAVELSPPVRASAA